MLIATYTNITKTICSKDILEKLYHQVLPYTFMVNVCRNGIFFIVILLPATFPGWAGGWVDGWVVGGVAGLTVISRLISVEPNLKFRLNFKLRAMNIY